jgi:hypothetical protein
MGVLLFVVQAAWCADALIQSTQKDWFTKQSCNSCHQQILPAMAIQAARAFAYLAGLDHAVQYTGIIDPAMSDGYELLAADAAGVSPNLL